MSALGLRTQAENALARVRYLEAKNEQLEGLLREGLSAINASRGIPTNVAKWRDRAEEVIEGRRPRP